MSKLEVIALHGNGQSLEIWNKLVQSQNLENFIPKSLAGHGQNEKLDSYSLEGHADFISEQIKNPCILMGHSLGAHIALRVAKKNKMIKKLILTGMPPLSSTDDMGAAFISENTYSHVLWDEKSNEDDLEKFCKVQQLDESYAKELHVSFLQQDPKHRSGLLASFGAGIEDEVQMIKDLSIPVQIILGDKDAFINFDYINSLGFSPVFITNCGHNIMIDRPDELIKYLH